MSARSQHGGVHAVCAACSLVASLSKNETPPTDCGATGDRLRRQIGGTQAVMYASPRARRMLNLRTSIAQVGNQHTAWNAWCSTSWALFRSANDGAPKEHVWMRAADRRA